MKVHFGQKEDIDQWMKLVTKVSDNFPGLETEEALEEHKKTVLKFIGKEQALCVKEGDKIVGVLLFSRGHNMICCLAVDTDYRREGFGSLLLDAAINELDRTKDITVTTFREGDAKGTAPRALYKKFGFVEGELVEEFGYPNQVFILPSRLKLKCPINHTA